MESIHEFRKRKWQERINEDIQREALLEKLQKINEVNLFIDLVEDKIQRQKTDALERKLSLEIDNAKYEKCHNIKCMNGVVSIFHGLSTWCSYCKGEGRVLKPLPPNSNNSNLT